MNLLNYYSFRVHSPNFQVDLIFVMVCTTLGAILFSNGLGLVLGGFGLYEGLKGCWMYYFNYDDWLSANSHGIGTIGFSFEQSFVREAISALIGFFIISQLVLSAIRCKEKGVGIWMALVPLYNPFALMLKK